MNKINLYIYKNENNKKKFIWTEIFFYLIEKYNFIELFVNKLNNKLRNLINFLIDSNLIFYYKNL